MGGKMNHRTIFGILYLIFLPFIIFINGSLIKFMWKLFIVPLGFSDINIAHALGIALLVGFLSKDTKDLEREEDFRLVFAIAFLKPLVVYIFALIYHSFMY